MTATALALYGHGMARDQLRRLADSAGLALWPPDAIDRDLAPAADQGLAPDPSLSPEPSLSIAPAVIAALATPPGAVPDCLWRPPFHAWIEVAGLAVTELAGLVDRVGRYTLFASLTTATAKELALANHLVSALSARQTLRPDTRDDIELAVHEAISNALIHGNLQISSPEGLSINSLERFTSDVARRLTDPSFADRRIEAACTLAPGAVVIEVADQGLGYTPVRSPSGPPPARRPPPGTDHRQTIVPLASGRGLDLIGALADSFEFQDGGRRIVMRFRL